MHGDSPIGKLKLDLNDLTIESFDTTPPQQGQAGGTVRGHDTQDTQCGQFTCGDTEPASCSISYGTFQCTQDTVCSGSEETCGGGGCPTGGGETCNITICGIEMC